MRVVRAHSYDHVSRVRAELDRLPPHWRETVSPWGLIAYPADLDPVWTGLVKRGDVELEAAGGAAGLMSWREAAAWTASSSDHAYWVRDVPHIFVRAEHIEWSILHEAGHALSRAWHVDEAAFFRPSAAFSEYMSRNPSEFFADALAAFLRPERDDREPNRADVARRTPELHAFLTAKLSP